MKIVSSFKDYYDGVVDRDADDGLLYVRKREHFAPITYIHADPAVPATLQPAVVAAHKMVFSTLYDIYVPPGESLQFGFIAVVGKQYTFACHKQGGAINLRDGTFYYDVDAVIDLIVTKGWKPRDSFMKQKTWEQRLRRMWTPQQQNWAEQLLPHHPVVAVIKNAPMIVEDNPILREYQFIKKMLPTQIYQELLMWFGNQASRDDTPITVSDKDRVKQYGFDEWSFRKLPTKHK